MSPTQRTKRIPLWLTAGILAVAAAQALAGEQTRLLFLGARGPVILDVTVDAGTRSVAEIRRQYAAGVFRRLDRDQDGRLSPDEAALVPRLGRLQAGAEILGEDWKQLDLDHNGSLSLDELTAHVQAAFGPLLAVEKAPLRRSQTARLAVDLDLNRDGRITREEIETGLEQLRSLDFDDDDALSVAELQPFPRSILESRQQRVQEESETLLVSIAADDEILKAAERCVQWYAADGGTVPRERLPGIEDRWFRAFDRDRDKRWSVAEFAQYLRRTPATYTLTAQLAKGLIIFPGAAMESARRPRLDLGGLPVEFQAVDRQWMQMDAVALHKINFRRSDVDKNGYLDPAEFVQMQVDSSFESVDLDGNGQVTLEEVQEFFTLDVLAQQSRLQILLSDETQSLFDILDTIDPKTLVRDFRLSPREMRMAVERLMALDVNGDGSLEPGEIARQFQIRFTRPELFDTRPAPADNAALAGRGQMTPVRNESGPLWFVRMDRNLDGEVSWREFLGPRETFLQLDKDGDGFIMEEEALVAERLREANRRP